MLKSEQRARFVVFVTVTSVYFVLNFQFTGPVYLADEIGYLANAAFFTGHNVDAASSYHAGYSILLIPAFVMFGDTWWLWKAVVATNALLFGITFAILYNVCTILSTHTSKARRILYTLICALYPAYLTGSGYAFAQPGQLLVFMIAVWCLLRWADSYKWILAHSAACGFLFWIHPTGLMTVIASIVTLTLRGHRESKWADWAVGVTVPLVIVAIYQLIIGPYIISSMTPEGHFPAVHYPSVGATLSQFASVTSVAEILARSLGVASYLTLASVGFAFWGAVFAARRSVSLFTRAPVVKECYVSVFCMLSLAGVIAVGSALFTPGINNESDAFFYGRYPESVLLPILLIGILYHESDRYLLAAIFILFSTIILILSPEFPASLLIKSQAFPIPGRAVEWWGMNFINATGFWPVVLPSGVPLWAMFAASALIVTVVGLFRKWSALACMVIVFSIGSFYAMQWHKQVFLLVGVAGSLPVLIQNTWPPKTCVGVDPDIPAGIDIYRYNLFKFYLRNFEYRRTTTNEWLTHCDGPLLTYRPEKFAGHGAEIVAKEKRTGLTLIARNGNSDVLEYPDLYTRSNGMCLTGWCLEKTAGELYSQVGQRESGVILSNGVTGFLVFGPYLPLPAGVYTATIDVSTDIPDGAYFDAVASHGNVTLAKSNVGDLIGEADRPTNFVQFTFTLVEPVKDFQLRLFVTAGAKIAFYGYTIVRISP